MITRHTFKTQFKSTNRSNLLPEDYLHFLFNYSNIKVEDILFAFIEILSPEFILYKNMIFIKDRFDVDKLRDGDDLKNAQYWQNLIYLSGIFSNMSDDEVMTIGNLIVDNWKLSMQKSNIQGVGKPKIICDSDDGIFLTICG
ncbi:MAG: hypothetical protein Q4B88_00590 [Moraxella sp.]|nr:hypothetical protein [Moraxella sp.]